MKNDMWKKGLVFGIICLFIGAGVTPNILVENVRADPGDGLVAYWSFDDINNIGYDDSGNGHNGDVHGATYTSSGVINGGLLFDGINDYVEVLNNEDFAFYSDDDFTINFWRKDLDNDASEYIACMHDHNAGQYSGWSIHNALYPGSDWGKGIGFFITEDSNSGLPISTEVDNDWHFVTIRKSGNEIILYVDAEEKASGTIESPYYEETHFLFGVQINDGVFPQITFFNGIMDEIRIYNSALSDSEIQQLYELGEDDQPPTASFTIDPYEGSPSTVFSFDASSSSDNEDDTDDLLVRWDWENDGAWDTDWTTDKIAYHQYSPQGTYTTYDVTLVVKDTADQESYSTQEVLVMFSDGDGVAENDEWELALQYFPVLIFDSSEKCYPTNMTYHLENSNLNLSKFREDELIKEPPLMVKDLEGRTTKHYMDNIRGEVEDNSTIIDHYNETREKYGDVAYVHVTNDKYKNVNYIAVQYWFYYAFNDGRRNNHEGDWEMVQVLLDETKNPCYIALTQHWWKQKLPWDDPRISTIGDHVIIYVANGSHANYIESFSTPRLFSRDIARGDGELLFIDDMDIFLLGERKQHPSYQNWLDFPGHWGDFGVFYKIGDCGPQGPMFRYDRDAWNKPAKWGIPFSLKKVILKCPANLTIIDNQSRKIGIIDGEFINEIPGAMGGEFGDTELYHLPDNLTYLYEVHGFDNGHYNFTIEYEIENINATAFNIPISPNTVHQYSVNWTALVQGENGVTLHIDSDGDGTFEKTITSDDELTQDEFMLQTETVSDIDPDTINLNSTGNWITCYIELPEGYYVEDINISRILLNDVVPAETHPTNISDYDNDSIPDLMVKFDRQDVIDILEVGDSVAITITGELNDETQFEGTDYIRVIE